MNGGQEFKCLDGCERAKDVRGAVGLFVGTFWGVEGIVVAIAN